MAVILWARNDRQQKMRFGGNENEKKTFGLNTGSSDDL